jgi:hypothetical protein
LYELETIELGAGPVIKAPVEIASVSTPSTQNLVNPDQKSHGRSPSIKFLGKRSLMKHAAVSSETIKAPVLEVKTAPQKFVPATQSRVIKEGTGVDFSTLKRGAMFGRPALSQREMDAIENGGATN